MHYPVMTEKQLATRSKISVKTFRRWRLDQVGPVWHKLFRYVRILVGDRPGRPLLREMRGFYAG